MTEGFRAYALRAQCGSFDELFASVRFEHVGKGRQGAVLVEPNAESDIPLVRTTTQYAAPPQQFRPIHTQLARLIQQSAGLSLAFNSALVEHYTSSYATMGGHSDQALDLAEGSLIAVFSSYRDPSSPSRRLLVEPKFPDGVPFELPLLHDQAVVFSLEVNRRFRHKNLAERARFEQPVARLHVPHLEDLPALQRRAAPLHHGRAPRAGERRTTT
ncbi:MAG: hypothetical protein QM756_04605 [Polyangiaceae bacterium]